MNRAGFPEPKNPTDSTNTGPGLLISGGSGPFATVGKIPYSKMAHFGDAPSLVALQSLPITRLASFLPLHAKPSLDRR
jgi:hypothetical protein